MDKDPFFLNQRIPITDYNNYLNKNLFKCKKYEDDSTCLFYEVKRCRGHWRAHMATFYSKINFFNKFIFKNVSSFTSNKQKRF